MRRLYSSLKCSPSVELQSAISTGGEHLCGWCVSDVGPVPPIQCWGSKRVFARAGSRGESVSYGSACLCLRGHHRSYPFGSIHFFSKGWDFTRAAELLKQPLEGVDYGSIYVVLVITLFIVQKIGLNTDVVGELRDSLSRADDAWLMEMDSPLGFQKDTLWNPGE